MLHAAPPLLTVSDRSGPGRAVAGDRLASPGRPPVFLHTGWRSGGTWMWGRCRDSARVQAYYEPLHEQVGGLRHATIASLRPGSWHSSHSETAPYFEEYHELIPRAGRGVELYRKRFAYDPFFMAPEEDDPELEAYLAALIGAPSAAGRVSVLKFCRSMGRVGWCERRFPDALHAVVLRDPGGQWQSARRLLTEQRNRYFTVAPLLVLARNARHPLVADAVGALDVTLPHLFSDDLAYGIETCWRHVQRLDDPERYRGFLAFWTACAVSALQSNATIIDSDLVGTNLQHRAGVEAALSAVIGDHIGLAPSDDRGDRPPCRETSRARRDRDVCAAHLAAAEIVYRHRFQLAPARAEKILSKLALDQPTDKLWHLVSIRPAKHRIAPPSPKLTASRKLRTAIAVVLARALQPIRRLHGKSADFIWRNLARGGSGPS